MPEILSPSLVEIEFTLARLYEPGQVIELRLYKDGTGNEKVIPQVGWFSNHQLLAETIVANEIYPACCKIGLNPIKQEFLEGKELNVLRVFEKNTSASDEWISLVRWILLDNDGPDRQRDTAATAEEKWAATEANLKLLDELRKLGFENSFEIADSGNGHHVLLRADLPAEGVKPLMRRIVQAAQLLAGDTVKIDDKTAYPSRPIKPYGVISHKGPNSSECPWRRTYLVRGTGSNPIAVPAPTDAIHRLAALAPEPKVKGVRIGPWAQDIMQDYLKWTGWKCVEPREYESGLKWVGPCILNSEHRDTAIILMNGWASYVCPHKKSHLELSFDKFKMHFEHLKNATYPYPTRSYGLNGIGDAERFADIHHGELRFCDPLGGWFRYEDGVYKLDESQQVMLAAHAVVRDMKQQAVTLQSEAARAALAKHAESVSHHQKLKAMLAQAESLLAAEHSRFDNSTMLFNCSNGTLDLRTMEFRPHRREDLLTKKTTVPYYAAATCELWDKFMLDITQGDVGLVRYLQKAVGYTLTGKVTEHALFILYGTGSNGKSTFKEILLTLFGDYAFPLPNNSLLVAGGINPEGASPVVAALRGSRFCVAVEPDSAGRLNEAMVKSVTGGDDITCRQLYKAPFTYTPQFSLWLLCNKRPRVHGTDLGLWRRVKMVGFNACFEGATADKFMKDKLRCELPGILNWALEGLNLYKAEGLVDPPAVSALTKAYRDENDQIGAFIEICVVPEETRVARMAASQADTFRRYRQWADQSGENYKLNARDLRIELESRGWEVSRDSRRGNVWLGKQLAANVPGFAFQDTGPF